MENSLFCVTEFDKIFFLIQIQWSKIFFKFKVLDNCARFTIPALMRPHLFVIDYLDRNKNEQLRYQLFGETIP